MSAVKIVAGFTLGLVVGWVAGVAASRAVANDKASEAELAEKANAATQNLKKSKGAVKASMSGNNAAADALAEAMDRITP